MTEPIRAITIQQPFAWAIAAGHKPVENRGRPVRYRGELAIHAGMAASDAPLPDADACRALDSLGGRSNVWDPRWYPPPLRRPTSAHLALALGAVIAVGQLVDCHPVVDIPALPGRPAHWCCQPWGQQEYNGRPGYHLVLADVRPLAVPVPCRGMQAVPWSIKDADVVAAVRAQLEGVSAGG